MGWEGRIGAGATRPRRSGRCSTTPDVLGLRRLDAYSFVDNPASARVLEKAGFTDLGVITRNYPARGGQRDVRHYQKKL